MVTFSYPRYKIPVAVTDSTSTANLTLLDRDARFLLKKPCSSLFPLPRVSQIHGSGILDSSDFHLPIFNQLIGGRYIFKIEMSESPRNDDPWQCVILRMSALKDVDLTLLSSEGAFSSEKVDPSSIDICNCKCVNAPSSVSPTSDLPKKKGQLIFAIPYLKDSLLG